jgi:four helix bundle protein
MGPALLLCMTNHIRNFTELKVWQRSMDLVVDLYDLTNQYPKSEMFVLTSHTRKSAISIPSNIAEGACRASTPTFIKHLHIALGSEAELYTQMECARRLGFAKDPRLEKYFGDLSEVGKMLRGLVRSLEAGLQRPERAYTRLRDRREP